MKVARIYLRVSTDDQDLTRQADIEHSTRAAGYYVAGIYREKASGARADRPELLRMISDLQHGVLSPNRRNLSNTPKLAITASQSQPKWIPSQLGSACRGMRSARENAGAAKPLVKFA